MLFLESLLDALASLIFSTLSAMGVGGGSLLLIYLTEVQQVSPSNARTLTLLLFFIAALGAIPFYRQKGYLQNKSLLLAVSFSAIPALLLGIRLSALLSDALLRRFFGGFLILTALIALFRKAPR